MNILYWLLIAIFMIDITAKLIALGIGEIPIRTPGVLALEVMLDVVLVMAIIAVWP